MDAPFDAATGQEEGTSIQMPCLLTDEALRKAEIVCNGDTLGIFLSKAAVSSVYRSSVNPVFQVYNLETGKLEKEDKVLHTEFGECSLCV